MTTTAPRPGQAGYIADPRTKAQIAAMEGLPQGKVFNNRAAPSVYEPYYGGKGANDILNLIYESEYGHGYDQANNVEDVTNRAGMPGGGGNPQADNAQQAFMAQRGIQGAMDEEAMKATERLLGNPGMHFGKGGGDWASAWTRQMSPLQSNFMKMYGGLDTDLFNSASGPYGQLQQAAAYTAPARSNRYVADRESETAKYLSDNRRAMAESMFGQLQQAINRPNIAGVETDYGAFAKVMPTLMAKYMPKR